MPTFTIRPEGPFSLAESAAFLCGFPPASGTATTAHGALTLGFLADATKKPAVVRVREDGTGLVVEHEGDADPAALSAQVARILSVDHDARPLQRIAARDPVVAAELARRPGFRPVVFPSPYEAAVWGVLAQRISMAQASQLRRRLSIATRATTAGLGTTFFPAPSPEALRGLGALAGIDEEKMRRLHAVADAASAGLLDATHLRALPIDEALRSLRTIRGLGVWTSQHVLFRGAGVADGLPDAEPRLLRAVGALYGLGRTATHEELAQHSEGWRPLRTWISVLLVSAIAGTSHWRGPEKRGAKAA